MGCLSHAWFHYRQGKESGKCAAESEGQQASQAKLRRMQKLASNSKQDLAESQIAASPETSDSSSSSEAEIESGPSAAIPPLEVTKHPTTPPKTLSKEDNKSSAASSSSSSSSSSSNSSAEDCEEPAIVPNPPGAKAPLDPACPEPATASPEPATECPEPSTPDSPSSSNSGT